MPFVLRTVQPVFVSRRKLTGPDGRPLVQDNELEAVFNGTLCCAIRQLSSLLENADDVFAGLAKEMAGIAERATALQQRLKRVQEHVDAHDPRLVTVPEGDLSAFAALPRSAHFAGPGREPVRALFLPETRPAALQRLYEAAARPTLDADALAQLDRLRRDGARSSALFLCTPTLGRTRAQRLRKKVVDIDIETRKPASIVELRRWTSSEALGDVTVHPDCTVRIPGDGLASLASPHAEDAVDGDVSGVDASQRLGESTLRPAEPADHQLPTTEEQVKAIADRFPPEVVRMDVTGRSFRRMSQCRRSLIHPGEGLGGLGADGRRTRPRRQRSRRRNTIAGTDQKEIEEALNGDRPSTSSALATVDDIILSSTSMISSNPKSSREANADFKKWAFNSLKRWGRSRLRAIASINAPASPNIVSGELHAADPVDDINVYETVAGKRRGAGHIPISAGLSGPMSLAVKLRESSLGQRRLKINDEPPHSSSGNWSASSESGRASVNSDSSHQPKSSTCSSVLPHRRRFINNSTSSSVTSEGTLTPEDMAAAPFLDDGETSSVYSCDTEGYYTSFHMDSGLKTLKEEEVGAGLSLPPTPMHSTSALSNCSSGRGSASLAQLTAESEYELFGKGSTSTTASSAGTVCTTLLADNSKGGDNSNGSDRSLCKGPAVPERKSSLNVPCLAQECPPCSTVVALIHNSNQGHSPCSISGDSPDSGHNTSSSPVESVSSPHDAETDALISPIPSIASEMEFSECSDFEGTDRIERIRVKTTINTSRIPSMCAITPPQSDDETNRNDNYRFTESGVNKQLTDSNANKATLDNNCNARPITPVTSASVTSIIQVDSKSGYATVHTLDSTSKENNINKKIRPPSPSGGTLFINTKVDGDDPAVSSPQQQPLIKDALIPFANILSKFRRTTHSGKSMSTESPCRLKSEVGTPDKLDDSGEYVTITDVRNNNKPNSSPCTPQRSEASEPARESTPSKTWESQEYVSLNELPLSNSADLQPSTVLSGSATESSLERRRRQGARVTLDSEGKVVYSSDSLRRRKGAHTTFAPGQCVKDPSLSPSPSPVANHRTPKAIIRPVQSQSNGLSQDLQNKSPTKAVTNINSVQTPDKSLQKLSNLQSIGKWSIGNGNESQKLLSTNQPSELSNQRNKVIIRAGIASPTKDLTSSSNRSMSPRTTLNSRGAYVHVQPSEKPSIKTNPMYLQTDFDGPEDSVKTPQLIQPSHKNIEDGFPLQMLKEPPPNVLQPLARRTANNLSQPLYQNISAVDKGQRSFNQPHLHSVAAINQQHRQAMMSASPQKNMGHVTHDTSQMMDAPLHSSTPTKSESTVASPLTVGNTFSPIEREIHPTRLLSNSMHSSYKRDMKLNGGDTLPVEGLNSTGDRKPSLLLSPKTTMTAEELYAKIHKSKKQMNIKYEPEIVLSPSPSVGSQSPVGSERSTSPSAASDPKTVARSRHSWSPNSSKYLDVASNYDPRSATASPNPKVAKDHGLTQVTSTHDFKRLLLQHGTGSTWKSKLSAVERLKQAKQVATSVLTNNTSKFRFGGGTSSSNSGISSSVPSSVQNFKPQVGKVAHMKSALLKSGPKSSWRFVGQKNDVRASPIIEEQREDEQSQAALQIQNLSSSPMPARNIGRLVARKQPTLDYHEKPSLNFHSLPKTPVTTDSSVVASQNNNHVNPITSSNSNKPSTIEPSQNCRQPRSGLKQPVSTKHEVPKSNSPTALETAL